MTISPRLLAPVLALALASASRAQDDSDAGCKAKLYNCGCLHKVDRLFETADLAKLGAACWGDLARFNIAKGKKSEVMDQAFEKARDAKKPVLYVGNTGG